MVDDTQAAEFNEMGVLQGHNDWVTCIATGHAQNEGEDSSFLITGSRDKSLMMWSLYEEKDNNGFYGQPFKQLTGHNHFISDISLSNDNNYLISSSWDKTMRLWDLRTGKTTRRFVGHTKEIHTCSFSADNRQIISAGADKTIKLWNTLADCKFTSDQFNHSDWVSCVRYSPTVKTATKQPLQPYFASVGWDGKLKLWNTNFQIRYSLKAHDTNVNAVAISPNGRYLATGGKDKFLNIWDISDFTEPLRQLEVNSTIYQIAFNPKFQWVAAATETGIKVWNLISQDNNNKPIADLQAEVVKKEGKKAAKPPQCTSLAWNAVGKKLFGGFSDSLIRVWHVNPLKK